MKRIFLVIGVSLLASGAAYSQVGVNTETPKATLEVTATSTAPTSAEGIIAPRLTRDQLTKKDAQYAAAQNGTIIYVTDLSGTTSPKTANITKAGYYYFNGTLWQPFSSTEIWAEDTTKKVTTLKVLSDGSTARTAGTEFAITDNGSVGIGTATPNSSAILQLNATDKGFLAPTVALTSTTDTVTIKKPAQGLLVYNSGKGGLTYNGYVYWNGNRWLSFNSSSLTPGTIGAITCNGVTANPSTYDATSPNEYVGTMMVPYTGGDGGMYPAMTLGPVNGLTATLESGNFNVGAGTLAFTVKGRPTVTTPTVTTFSLNIGGQTCSASIGAGTGIALGDLVYFQGDFLASSASGLMSDSVKNMPVLGGKLRLDMQIFASSNGGQDNATVNPVLVNITDKPVKLWYSSMTSVDRFNAANFVVAPKGVVSLDNVIYLNVGLNDRIYPDGTASVGSKTAGWGRMTGIAANQQEVVTVDISLDSKWYRIYYFPTVDNMNTDDAKDNRRRIYISIQRLY